MSLILRKQCVNFSRQRLIYMPPTVIELKGLRSFATEPSKLPENDNTKVSRSAATWLKTSYEKLIGTYEELSGMKEVRLAQEEVVRIQEKLQDIQEKRRQTQLKLLEIQKSLHDVNKDINAIDKGNPHYLELVHRQFDLMQEEHKIQKNFQITDTNERDSFTYLTSAVRSSHEKERSQAEYAKSFSMTLTMIGAVLGILGSYLTYTYRNQQYKVINEQGKEIEKNLQRLEREMTRNFIDLQALIQQGLSREKERKAHQESWTDYFKRHGSNVYRYFVPKK